MMTGDEAAELRQQILGLCERYAEAVHGAAPFVPGTSAVPPSGKVLGAKEMRLLVDSCLDFWLTTGRFNAEFEQKLAQRTGVLRAITTNSGSSANLLATTALTSHLLGEEALQPGDEVITCATGFPTTVNPTLQNGLVPVFLDVELGTYNIDVRQLEDARSPRTRAIMAAHTLGNPFDLAAITAFAKKHDLLLVEDCCDALGATYQRQASRHVRRYRHAQSSIPLIISPWEKAARFLSQSHDLQTHRGIVPRLGPRLLLRSGQGQYLQPPFRLATRRSALRL